MSRIQNPRRGVPTTQRDTL